MSDDGDAPPLEPVEDGDEEWEDEDSSVDENVPEGGGLGIPPEMIIRMLEQADPSTLGEAGPAIMRGLTSIKTSVELLLGSEIPEAVWRLDSTSGSSDRREDLRQAIHYGAMMLMIRPQQIDEVLPMVEKIEKLLVAAKDWPTEPRDLFIENARCLLQQRYEYGLEVKGTSDIDPKVVLRPGAPYPPPPLPDAKDVVPVERLPQWVNDPERSFANPGPVKLCPQFDESILTRFLKTNRPQRICFSLDSGSHPARLTNPLRLSNSHEGYICDFCNCRQVQVAWQIAHDDGSRDVSQFYASSSGFDVCVACGVFCLWESDEELVRFLKAPVQSAVSASSGLTGSAPLERGKHHKADVLVHQLRFGMDDQGKPAVAALAAIAPRGSHLLAWCSEIRSTAGNQQIDDTLPDIPMDWRTRVKIRAHESIGRQSSTDDFDGLGECCMCLDELVLDNGDCVQTSCQHWFHVSCIRRLVRDAQQHEEQPKCPLCRSENPIIPNEDPQEVLVVNLYQAVVTPAPSPSAAESSTLTAESYVIVAVGCLLSMDGKYDNATDLGAVKKFRVPFQQGKLSAAE